MVTGTTRRTELTTRTRRSITVCWRRWKANLFTEKASSIQVGTILVEKLSLVGFNLKDNSVDIHRCSSFLERKRRLIIKRR